MNRTNDWERKEKMCVIRTARLLISCTVSLTHTHKMVCARSLFLPSESVINNFHTCNSYTQFFCVYNHSDRASENVREESTKKKKKMKEAATNRSNNNNNKLNRHRAKEEAKGKKNWCSRELCVFLLNLLFTRSIAGNAVDRGSLSHPHFYQYCVDFCTRIGIWFPLFAKKKKKLIQTKFCLSRSHDDRYVHRIG